MPSLQDLEQFRSSFRSIGGESTTLAARGEAYTEFELPEAAEDVPADMDFGAFLDTIPEDLLSGFAEEIEAERGRKESDVPNFDPFDVDTAAGDAADLEISMENEPERDGKGTGEPSMDALAFDLDSGDDFSLPTFEPDSTPGVGDDIPLETEFDEGYSLFSEAAPENEPEGEVSSLSPLTEEESFDFSIPEIGAGESIPSPSPVGSPDLGAELRDTFPTVTAAIEEPTLDSFDTFSLDESTVFDGFGLRGSKPGEGELGGLEEFSLEGIDDVFEVTRVPPSTRQGERPTEIPQDVEEISLSERDLTRLEETLASYPLNLRIICEELIVEQAVSPELMSSLIKSLVQGSSAKETASLAGKILGRTVSIPRSFEKRTGEELEEEKSTFAYAFIHQFLPIVRLFVSIVVVVTSLAYLAFEFVYTPLRAEALYKAGYERIGAGEYQRAIDRFTQALMVRRKKRWFYSYAEAFRDKGQFIHAQNKYDLLLRNFPRDKKGVLDYALMEATYLRNYSKADRLIRDNILDFSVDDREGLLALGDVNLAWAELDPSRYEEARRAFARLIERYGRRDPYLERMLKYFIRTDNLVEVLALQGHFMSSPRTRIGASTLAEMGGYLLGKKLQELRGVPDENIERISGFKELFNRAIHLDPTYPESYYYLAKYYSRFGKADDERRILEQALNVFQDAPELSARRVGYRIDSHRRLALLLRDNREFISAEERLEAGISLYEDAVDRRFFSRSGRFGRLYADLGDIEYFIGGDLSLALRHYGNARLNGWAPSEVWYRVGFAHYHRREWARAVEAFFESSLGMPLNRRLLFSLGNASYMRGNYHAAQGYFNRLLDMLELERSRFPMLFPNDRPDHLELAERIMRTRNNLGVVLEALAGRSGDNALRARALALYTESAQAWDALTRNPVSVVRSASANLAFLNTRNSLNPEHGFEAQLYMEIDKDVLEPSRWEELLPLGDR